jgi:hypothetical protein
MLHIVLESLMCLFEVGHPQSDGMVERYNSTMEAMSATCVTKDLKNWDALLPLQMMAYRSAEHDTTKYSP